MGPPGPGHPHPQPKNVKIRAPSYYAKRRDARAAVTKVSEESTRLKTKIEAVAVVLNLPTYRGAKM